MAGVAPACGEGWARSAAGVKVVEGVDGGTDALVAEEVVAGEQEDGREAVGTGLEADGDAALGAERGGGGRGWRS